MHDIQYDAVHDEFVFANSFGQAILTFRGGADGGEPPLRVIQGPRTQLEDPDRVDVDPVHNELFTVTNESVLVFPRLGNGDVAPIRVIRGPDTMLTRASALAVDPVNNLIVVRVRVESPTARRGTQLLIFNRTDNGNVKPRAVIGGPKTGFLEGSAGNSQLRVYPPKGWIFSPYKRSELDENDEYNDVLAVWSIHDNGDVPPRWAFGGPKSKIHGLRVAFNPKTKEVVLGGGRTLKTFYLPELF